MIGFVFKKFFYDLWDNLFSLTALNGVFLLSLSLTFALPPLVPPGPGGFPLGMILFGLMVFWLFVYVCAAAALLRDVSDYRRISLAGLGAKLKSALPPAALLFTAAALVFFVLRFTVPAYLSMGGMAGRTAALFSCWICLFLLAAIQFYPAVYHRLGTRPVKCLKKCVLFFLDNPGFCFVSLVLNILLTVLVISSPAWPLLYLDEALRLRLLKYDWLTAEKETPAENTAAADTEAAGLQSRKKIPIPWDQLLAEERESTGERSWKSFIFPWKE